MTTEEGSSTLAVVQLRVMFFIYVDSEDPGSFAIQQPISGGCQQVANQRPVFRLADPMSWRHPLYILDIMSPILHCGAAINIFFFCRFIDSSLPLPASPQSGIVRLGTLGCCRSRGYTRGPNRRRGTPQLYMPRRRSAGLTRGPNGRQGAPMLCAARVHIAA